MSHIANVTTVAIALSTATLCVPSALFAQDVKLPPTLTFTAYDMGSSGFNIAVDRAGGNGMRAGMNAGADGRLTQEYRRQQDKPRPRF